MLKEKEAIQVGLERQVSPVSLALVVQLASQTSLDLWETPAYQDWTEHLDLAVFSVPPAHRAQAPFRERAGTLDFPVFQVDPDPKASPATLGDPDYPEALDSKEREEKAGTKDCQDHPVSLETQDIQDRRVTEGHLVQVVTRAVQE